MTAFIANYKTSLSVLATIVVLSIALLVQHSRHGWPFYLHHNYGASANPTKRVSPAGEQAKAARVPIDVDPAKATQIGIRVQPVKHEAVTQPIQAVATVAIDESRISHVHTRVAGWVEELYVNTTGEYVRTGGRLARIFSQELLSSQTEYLVARRYAAVGPASAVVESGRTRLKVLGMTEAEIQAIERTGEPMRLVTVYAPKGGVVMHRGISVGTAVDPSTELMTIADLSAVWVLAEIPEVDMKGITVGMSAMLDFPTVGQPFPARVAFIYPTLTERTRTLQVRLIVSNPKGTLRPGLYGSAEFQAVAKHVLTVPRDAVIDTGSTQHVFVATTPGRFEPREVVIGTRRVDSIEIESGLKEGEQVVSSGVFLLDSESRLQASSGAMSGHSHGSAPAKAKDAPKKIAQPQAQPQPQSHEQHKD